MTMDRFRLLPGEIPEFLYRVDYEGSATIYSPDRGLEAQDTVSTYNSDHGFGDATQRHLNWDHEFRSVFISLFSFKSHTINWMKTRNTHCNLLKIDTTALRDLYVFRAQQIEKELRLSVRETASASLRNEYLVLHRIPAAAITLIETRLALGP
ncbi:hypothetical protein BJX62DRAFT_194115 [Aspergillus germanicus]